jgi:aldehyde:ferredoxin oxidoreductase
MRASQKLGKNAEEIALHVKGQELPIHDPRGKKGVAIQYATSPRGACHLAASHDGQFESDKNLAEEIGIVRPLDPAVLDRDKVRLVKILNDLKRVEDSLTICYNVTFPYGIRMNTLQEVVRAATGLNLTINEILNVGERAENICRAFNIREGAKRKDDELPNRLFEPLPDGPMRGTAITREEFENALTMYYEERGWNSDTGVPTKEKLEELGLNFIWNELQKSE